MVKLISVLAVLLVLCLAVLFFSKSNIIGFLQTQNASRSLEDRGPSSSVAIREPISSFIYGCAKNFNGGKCDDETLIVVEKLSSWRDNTQVSKFHDVLPTHVVNRLPRLFDDPTGEKAKAFYFSFDEWYSQTSQSVLDAETSIVISQMPDNLARGYYRVFPSNTWNKVHFVIWSGGKIFGYIQDDKPKDDLNPHFVARFYPNEGQFEISFPLIPSSNYINFLRQMPDIYEKISNHPDITAKFEDAPFSTKMGTATVLPRALKTIDQVMEYAK